MNEVITFRGRSVTEEEIDVVRKIIAAHPDGSRRFISQEVCRVWDWRQANGILKDQVCRTLLLLLESKGFIKQPPPKCTPPNPLANRKKPARITIDQTPVEGTLKNLQPVTITQVRRTSHEKLFNSLISQFHYLGYTKTVGEHLKYMAFANDRPVACVIWGSVPWHIGVRDRFIGWSVETRKKNLHLIANNTRFLILPWVRVPHLASHILALSRRVISRDWQEIYNHPIHLVETFVDTEKFKGTCYRADNWIYTGKTTGRGKDEKTLKQTRSKKAVYVYPLQKNFREKLAGSKSSSPYSPEKQHAG
ncbi:MAG: DUF4338 domain-containing protein [Candidatus Auribacterota bacterium]|nr:DUF4338 domain-containing protein [Candidatus Auribacterota bacterium]